jgi:YgiT-type zinc finger domain-containing protein
MAGLRKKEIAVFACIVCNAEESRIELVEEVFKVDGQYVLVDGVPSMVCLRCGERSFSRETTEKVRQMVHGQAKATRSIPMRVYEFA